MRRYWQIFKFALLYRFRFSLWEIRIGRLGSSLKILYFVLKNEWPFGYKFQNFVLRYKKNEWPFGYNSKFRILLLKKTNHRLGTTVKFRISL